MATQAQPQPITNRSEPYKWSLVIDLDRCTGCQACVVACQSENNVSINTEAHFLQHRQFEWIRIERYWDKIDPNGPDEWPNLKARFLPLMCQECENAPCEPVCPVYATYHNNEGLNVQVYNRCVGTRYCGNNCPYHARMFNWWEPVWPDSLQNQLNPDVTVRSRGIMERCSMCIQRIRRATRNTTKSQVPVDSFETACAQACPTGAITFGDLLNPESKAAKLHQDPRAYTVMQHLGTSPSVVYLKKVETQA